MSDIRGLMVHIGTYELGGTQFALPPCPLKHFPTFLTTPVGVGFRPYPKEVCMLFCVKCSPYPLAPKVGRHAKAYTIHVATK